MSDCVKCGMCEEDCDSLLELRYPTMCCVNHDHGNKVIKKDEVCPLCARNKDWCHCGVVGDDGGWN